MSAEQKQVVILFAGLLAMAVAVGALVITIRGL
jgi:hypothetical protein